MSFYSFIAAERRGSWNINLIDIHVEIIKIKKNIYIKGRLVGVQAMSMEIYKKFKLRDSSVFEYFENILFAFIILMAVDINESTNEFKMTSFINDPLISSPSYYYS